MIEATLEFGVFDSALRPFTEDTRTNQPPFVGWVIVIDGHREGPFTTRKNADENVPYYLERALTRRLRNFRCDPVQIVNELIGHRIYNIINERGYCYVRLSNTTELYFDRLTRLSSEETPPDSINFGTQGAIVTSASGTVLSFEGGATSDLTSDIYLSTIYE